MMPGKDGIETDDYIVKPFSPREVVLRESGITSCCTNNILYTRYNDKRCYCTHLTIDNDAHRVTADGNEANLTPKEYELLLFFSESS